MCGIAGVHRLTDRPFPGLDRFCGKLLDGIEERGTDATGYVAVDDIGGVQLQKASCRAFYFNANRARIDPLARTVLLHTRWATQGKAAFPENNHPVEAGGIYCVHNGHIWNDDALFRDSGKPRCGQVDSESIPALIASSGWGSIPKCLEEIDGDFAVALVSPKQPGELVLAKGAHSPLVYVKTEHLLVWASTLGAILKAWNEVLGTPPNHSRFRWMDNGESLLVDGAKMRTERFAVAKWVWEPSKTVVSWKDYSQTQTKPLKETGVEVELPSLQMLEAGDEIEEGIDIFRCEDCGDWVEDGELKTVQTYGFSSQLCEPCAVWALEIAKVT